MNDMITIDVFSDPICPWCFIGKKRLEDALAARPDVPVSIRWRTFQLNPDMPTEGMDRQSYLSAKFGGPDRAADVYGHIRQVGQQVGIDFQFDAIPRTPSTLAAHRLIRFAQREYPSLADALVQSMFKAYFLDGQDIGEVSTLLAIADSVGMDRGPTETYLQGTEDLDEVKAEDSFARRLGIGGVPCFIIEGKYALSGAQEPEAFLPVLDMAVQEKSAEGSGPSPATGGA
ncbi:MAG: DsbA family oxidoreductase [Alphaproteobacteria bacterium]